ncbi:hypothetical protein BpHYR1_042863 [Brachionus plicatilis]|uniref:Uncharacterized protein n=1 Tax=Brachionus plicatilis TaxID=10195 RepID=A0A3M7PW19_BRAPC|nr:hypothetical protein BpHYR1_042863 [Brachionus plicatilis]
MKKFANEWLIKNCVQDRNFENLNFTKVNVITSVIKIVFLKIINFLPRKKSEDLIKKKLN